MVPARRGGDAGAVVSGRRARQGRLALAHAAPPAQLCKVSALNTLARPVVDEGHPHTVSAVLYRRLEVGAAALRRRAQAALCPTQAPQLGQQASRAEETARHPVAPPSYEAYQRALGPPIVVLYGGKTLDELLRQHGRGEPSAASSGFTSSSDDEGSGSDASADQPEGARDGSEGSTCSSADSSVSSGLVLRRVVKVNREPDLTWLDWDTPAGRRRSIEAWLVELGASAAKEGDGNAGSTS